MFNDLLFQLLTNHFIFLCHGLPASDNSPADPLAAARALLQPGEQLVWADRPGADALVRAKLPQVIRGGLGLAVIAGFLWLSFLPNWPGGANGLLLAVLLVVAVLYALWLLAAPLVARRAVATTVYAVTDRRVVVGESWPFRRLASFTPAELDAPQVMPGEGGRGTVVFISRKKPWWRRSAGGSYQIEAFFGIAEAARVGELIAELRSPAPESPEASDSGR
jgi:hypothetical protein